MEMATSKTLPPLTVAPAMPAHIGYGEIRDTDDGAMINIHGETGICLYVGLLAR